MKERAVVFAPEARTDLAALYDMIAAAASPQRAMDYVERLEAFCRGFSTVAERGTRRDDIRPGLRVTGFERRVAIAFTVGDEQVVILRLFYGGRNWEGQFADEKIERLQRLIVEGLDSGISPESMDDIEAAACADIRVVKTRNDL